MANGNGGPGGTGKALAPGEQQVRLEGDGVTLVVQDFPPLALRPVEIRLNFGYVLQIVATLLAQQALKTTARPVHRPPTDDVLTRPERQS